MPYKVYLDGQLVGLLDWSPIDLENFAGANYPDAEFSRFSLDLAEVKQWKINQITTEASNWAEDHIGSMTMSKLTEKRTLHLLAPLSFPAPDVDETTLLGLLDRNYDHKDYLVKQVKSPQQQDWKTVRDGFPWSAV